MSKNKPDSFDWVTERHNVFPDCSLSMIFAMLIEITEKNVETINSKGHPDVRFVHKPIGKTLIVGKDRALNGGVEIAAVLFELLDEEIRVSKRPGIGEPKILLFSAKRALSEDGQCTLDVDGHVLRLWQVSKKALEPFFFCPRRSARTAME
jgi:hypothetical protein